MTFALPFLTAATEALLACRERWSLWLPVGIGAGIALYFSLPVEPGLAVALAPGAALCGALAVFRRRPVVLLVLLALAAPAAGFAAARLRAEAVATPVVPARLGPIAIEATLEEIEARPGERPRAVFGAPEGDFGPDAPRRIRVSFDAEVSVAGLEPGARVRFSAVLLPPPGPVLPGAPDYGRNLWFEGIGAVGYATSAPLVTAPGGGSLDLWRQRVALGLVEAMPAPAGGIAAALMLGLRGAVPEVVEERWRAAGISHILSISGLHIGLAAGVVLFSLRLLFAAVPRFGLRHPIKKWAAAAAILSAGAYMVVAGMDVPAQRSFIMTAVVLLAVLADRLAITLRLVAIAAGIVLLAEPESLMAPGFGMSFASVTGLVAGYEVGRPVIARWRAGGGWLRRGLIALGGILITSLIATLATAPFAIAHFGRISLYGLIANLVAIPVTGAVIMPAAVGTALLAPLGLEAPALVVLGFGITLVDDLAAVIAKLPGAVLAVPAMSQGGLLFFVLGGLCICLWRGGLRLTGLPLLGLGLFAWLAGAASPPLLLVHGEGRAIAAPQADRLLALAPASPRFAVEQWAERLGLSRLDVLPGREACRAGLCRLALRDGREVVVAGPKVATSVPCAAIVVVLGRAEVDCPGASLILRREEIGSAGTLAVGADGHVSTTEAGRGARPWVPRPNERGEAPAQ